MTPVERARTWIEAHVAERAPRETASHEAGWKLAQTGEEEWERAAAREESAIRRLLSDRESFARLGEFRAELARDADDDLRRQVELAWLDFAANQTDPQLLEQLVALEATAESTYARFRPDLDGRAVSENEIRGILRDSEDLALRRRAWEASKAIGPVVAPTVLEMVELRNRAARDMGHSSYWSMDLVRQEIDEDFLISTFDRLVELSRDAWDEFRNDLFARQAKRFGITATEVRPWHLADPFFQEAPAPADLDLGRFYEGADLVTLTKRFCERLGFDIDATIERSDLFPREGKNQHAFCTHVDRSIDDVRVLCNVATDEYWMDTMLHEFGHAVYDLGLGRDLPWLLRAPAHTLSTEAIALLFGRFASDPDWLVHEVGAPASAIDAIREPLAAYRRAKLLTFTRWVMVMVHFERGLYADPTRDLNAFWWELVERFQGVPRPEGREGAADWACKLHVALAPAYYHNYLLGDLMASQLDAWLASETGTSRWFEKKQAGTLLSERLFRHGARRPWNEALRFATGESLDPAPYVEPLARTA
ncbi:MAG: M2 family metallopeptidase [Gemmatimonadetes bacterium]|nr:M2 family metallopeptidase [Gemmatimonadota bacterium]